MSILWVRICILFIFVRIYRSTLPSDPCRKSYVASYKIVAYLLFTKEWDVKHKISRSIESTTYGSTAFPSLLNGVIYACQISAWYDNFHIEFHNFETY